jgi:hypothetical protein
MEQMSFHKSKLYSLIIAGVALVALILPWISVEFFGVSKSWNGFRGWGILSLTGIIGVIALSFMGNKSEEYNSDFKKYIAFAFGAIALGALLFFLRKNAVAGGGASSTMFGDMSDIIKTGIGLWICLIAGIAGLGLHFGFIKVQTKPPVT